jgi:hypothetical protein
VRYPAALVASAALAFSTTAFAQGQFGTAAEAKAMLEKAVTELKANEAAALAKFTKGEGGFKDRDLYVFCYDMTTRQVHGTWCKPIARRHRRQSAQGEGWVAARGKSVQRN